ncbi:MAG: AtpZ/AtpI family protein [Planctomyces sp.]|nr:AtpZ/AtpI family protein [Planctomyces sp.]
MPDDPAKRSNPELAEATIWLSRIATMIAPGLVGLWLDHRFGTRYLALCGLVLGVLSGGTQIVQAMRKEFGSEDRPRSAGDSEERRPSGGTGP